MTGASTGRSSPARRAGEGAVSRVLAAALAGVERLWHAVGSIAELLSDAGHGPRRWRERSDIPNPYAGAGPIPRDDRHPEADE